jgi:acyl-CoA synthetase (AMP-forming)/AMP-acid ligase II
MATSIASVYQRFVATAAERPQADALWVEAVTAAAYGIAPGGIRWGDVAAEAERLREAYAAAGYGHGHRVALLLENRPAFLFHWLALNALGCSVVPLHADLRAAELEYMVGHSDAVLAVVLPHRVADLQAAARAAGQACAAVSHEVVGREDLPPAASPAPRAGERIGLGSECALLYTSGTTGRPKGCRLSNDYFLRAGRWYAQLDGVCEVRPHQERIITPLPLNHVNAMAFSTMVVWTLGGCLVQLDRFHPASWWDSVRESGATLLHYLGVMPAMLLSAPASSADRQHGVRWAFGAGVDRRNHAAFEERFGLPLVEAWAMTETGAAACIMANHEPRQVGTHCFGKPEPFVQVRLVDDAGQDVPVGEPGELLVRSSGPDPRAGFFSGYLKDEATTEESWAGGWFHTGDVVRADAQGLLYFVDRRKNVIRRSGENISALEVESVLNQHPAVKTSAVAATPDAVRGDEVLACIVSREPVPATEREAMARSLVDHALQRLAYYKAPGYVAFVESLPLTVSQKIQRGQLKDLARTLPGQAHCIDTRALKKRTAA